MANFAGGKSLEEYDVLSRNLSIFMKGINIGKKHTLEHFSGNYLNAIL